MREIKFRAWQNAHKRMREVWSIDWKDGEIKYVSILQPKTAPASQVYGTEEYPLSFLNLMQYTGLKDKNGLEIYEGDILSNPTDATVKVEWDDKWAQFVAIDADDGQQYGLFANVLDDGRKTYEKVGNIYQNPELIK